MNFWEAYQKMKAGIWCQIIGEKYPYRFANGRWETVSTKPVGQGVNELYTLCTGEVTYTDRHEYKPFIAPIEEDDYVDRFYFGFDSLEAEWETVVVDYPRIEDRPEPTPSPEKAAREKEEDEKRREYFRLHPPLKVSITKEDIFTDKSSVMMAR